MEDSKLQKLHETLKALAPKGKVGGLGFYAKAGHRSRRSAADGMPEDKRALVQFLRARGRRAVRAHALRGRRRQKTQKKKKKKKTKAPPPPPLLMSRLPHHPRTRTRTPSPPPKKTKKRKEAAARLADIDAAYESAQAAKARSIDEAFGGESKRGAEEEEEAKEWRRHPSRRRRSA